MRQVLQVKRSDRIALHLPLCSYGRHAQGDEGDEGHEGDEEGGASRGACGPGEEVHEEGHEGQEVNVSELFATRVRAIVPGHR